LALQRTANHSKSAIFGHVLNDKKLLEQSFFMTDKMQPEPDKNTF